MLLGDNAPKSYLPTAIKFHNNRFFDFLNQTTAAQM